MLVIVTIGVAHVFIPENPVSLEYPNRCPYTASLLQPYHHVQLTPTVNNLYDPTNALNDIPGLHWALHEFLQSHMHKSDSASKAILKNRGCTCLVQCVKGLMSFEDKDLLAAINHTKHGIAVASAHCKCPNSFAGSLADPVKIVQ
ncbi:uncharacterized protein BJ212DRAFT_1299135 [Suillus subaureus]|uniref:Uncharacterized protein n=1 Tax=Suillus subaureus TaxID=48587 RepID=A0A9P7JE87_9AGAM|nr:uncharacterized protein BJ212DRAFT_1299135 [Suillus subaureus]KAG1817596.1 hypothetical protein BJ212DRAFT_1299135 [Suillus subaureus]